MWTPALRHDAPVSRSARTHRVTFRLLLAVVATGTVAFLVSSSRIEREVNLTRGHTISFSVFRLFPERLHLMLEFRRDPGAARPAKPLAWHPHPDAPVTVTARLGERQAVYAAEPASAFGYESMWRDLAPIAEQGDPRRIPRPARLDLALELPAGFSQVDLAVGAVDPALDGEPAHLSISPPVGFKMTSSHPGYQLLWWFHLWPVFLGGTALYGLVMAALLRRRQRGAPASSGGD